jgi:hypothetical protein
MKSQQMIRRETSRLYNTTVRNSEHENDPEHDQRHMLEMRKETGVLTRSEIDVRKVGKHERLQIEAGILIREVTVRGSAHRAEPTTKTDKQLLSGLLFLLRPHVPAAVEYHAGNVHAFEVRR